MGRHREFDVGKALDKAMKVFWQKGYEGASVSDLTEAMGINSPSLYAAFGSKEGLFAAVLDRYGAARIGYLSQILEERSARDVALRFLCGLADYATDKQHPPGCLLVQAGLSCGEIDIPKRLAHQRAGVELALRERFETAKREGDLPADADPAALARYLMAVANGICLQAAAGSTREELRKVAEMALAGFPVAPKPQKSRAGRGPAHAKSRIAEALG